MEKENRHTETVRDFVLLTKSIQAIDSVFKEETAKAVNCNLTARNWMIGYYLFEYEQRGNDRAKYGKHLIQSLAKELNSSSLSQGNLKLFRQFYQEFPQLLSPVQGYIASRKEVLDYLFPIIGQTPLGQLENGTHNTGSESKDAISQTSFGQLNPNVLFCRIPYSHLTLLFPIKDPIKRTFYEIECLKGTWSFRELKRQIDSNYFERTALAASPEKMSVCVQQRAEKLSLAEVVKSPHVYEFLGL